MHTRSAVARPFWTNGIVVIALLVFGGMGIGAAYYHWKAPRILAEMERERAELPASPEQRVARWLEFGSAFVHQRLVQLRMSARQPWLVTHVVVPKDPSQAPEIWGVDFAELEPSITTREGLDVVVTLPPVALLGRGELEGDNAANVPRVAEGVEFDGRARAEALVRWALERLIVEGLQKDIPGASLVVRIGAAQ